jgi:hypothetical protein
MGYKPTEERHQLFPYSTSSGIHQWGGKCQWGPEPLSFKATFEHASIEARTAGCLRISNGKEICAIVEVKLKGRHRARNPAEDSAQMMAWVYMSCRKVLITK